MIFTLMKFPMVFLANYQKIFQTIIKPISVNVMHFFTWTKRPPKMFFHYNSVFVSSCFMQLRINNPIPLYINRSSLKVLMSSTVNIKTFLRSCKRSYGNAVSSKRSIYSCVSTVEPFCKNGRSILCIFKIKLTNKFLGFYVKFRVMMTFFHTSNYIKLTGVHQ